MDYRHSRWMGGLIALGFVVGCSGGGTGETEATGATESTTAGTTESTGSMNQGDPAAQAQAECDAIFACECSGRPWSTIDDCVAVKTAEYDQAAALAEQHGLSWDPECAQAKIDRWTNSCTTDFADGGTCRGDYCALYVGQLAQDEACEQLGNPEVASQCAPNSVCALGFCSQYCRIVSGGPCDSFLGAMCAPGTQCVYVDLTSSCGTPPGVGEFCDFVGPDCAEGLYCENSTCFPQEGAGGPCEYNGQCLSLECTDFTCAAIPDQVGSPCSNAGTCGGGLACDHQTDTCQPEPNALCVLVDEAY